MGDGVTVIVGVMVGVGSGIAYGTLGVVGNMITGSATVGVITAAVVVAAGVADAVVTVIGAVIAAAVIMALMCFYRIGRHVRGVTSKDDSGHVPGETEPVRLLARLLRRQRRSGALRGDEAAEMHERTAGTREREEAEQVAEPEASVDARDDPSGT